MTTMPFKIKYLHVVILQVTQVAKTDSGAYTCWLCKILNGANAKEENVSFACKVQTHHFLFFSSYLFPIAFISFNISGSKMKWPTTHPRRRYKLHDAIPRKSDTNYIPKQNYH